MTDYEQMLDAALFEALVARKLLRMPNEEPPCPYGQSRLCTIECGNPWLDCEDCRLKWARIEVEAEMDG